MPRSPEYRSKPNGRACAALAGKRAFAADATGGRNAQIAAIPRLRGGQSKSNLNLTLRSRWRPALARARSQKPAASQRLCYLLFAPDDAGILGVPSRRRWRKCPRRPRDRKADIPDAPKILRGNVYGWFVPVERGVYTLAESGRAALLRWPQSAPPTVQHAPSRAYRSALRARVSQFGRSSTICR